MKLALAMVVIAAAACSKSKPADECAEFRATIAKLRSCPALASELDRATKELTDLSELLAKSGAEPPPELAESIRETCKSQNTALVALGCHN